ncbi:MAG: helix-turn-helix domain-containing protein [Coriobacteriales bacterium]|jgi:hypothetical protein|nr:helix-turn-helix domain-containing protein [Coriobacteriales bacterium]
MIVYFSNFSSKARKGIRVISPDPARIVVARQPLKGADLPLKEDCLYYGKVSELPTPEMAAHTNLLLLIDEEDRPFLYDRNRTNKILASTAEDFERLYDETCTVFEIQIQVNNFASRLLQLVQNESKTEELLELGYQALGNPLLLLDTSLCLLSSIGAELVEDDPIIEYVMTKGYMPEQFIEEVMREESNAPGDDKVLIIWEKDFLKHRLIAGRVVRGNRLVAYCKLFEYNRPITAVLDIEIFKVLCQYLALSMGTNLAMRQPGAPFVETFLLDIIERKLADRTTIQERIKLYNLEFHEFLVAIIVEMEERFRKTDKLLLLKQMLKNLFKRDAVFIYDDALIIVYDNASIEGLSERERIASFVELLKTHHCRAAISMPFHDLDALYTYYNQAVTCFDIADQMKSTERALRYEDLILEHMVLRFGEVFDLYDLIPPSVWELSKIDTQKGSSLVDTLFCYVRHRQDITSAASAMHVHYNTLKYRVNKISEMAGIDLNDPEVAFRIMLAERVLVLLRRIEKNEAFSPVHTAKRLTLPPLTEYQNA